MIVNIGNKMLIDLDNIDIVYCRDEPDYMTEGRYGLRIQFRDSATNKNYLDLWFKKEKERDKLFKQISKYYE